MGTGAVIAADIGSSVLKAVQFDSEGAVRAVARRPVTTHSPDPRSHQQDPDEWWQAFAGAVAELPDSSHASAVVLTGSMQNLIALDAAARPLAPAVLYSDRRLDEEEIATLSARLPADYAKRTGNRLDPAHTILKLMMLPRFVPAATGRRDVRWAFGAKDAISFRLTGSCAIDPTTASTTGLMGITTRDWDGDLVVAAGINPTALPKILAGDEIVGHLSVEAAKFTGLPAGIPVFNGAGDAATATWGAYADSPGRAYCYLGTTGWVAATLDLADAAPPREIYTLADPLRRDRVIIVSPFLTAGAALDWLAETTDRDLEELLVGAAAKDMSPPAAMFLPYLKGERGPFEDSRVRGAFLGLDHATTAEAMAYAAIEGIAFAVRHNLDMAGLPPSPLTVIGGAARHYMQRQIMADVLGREIAVLDDSQETAALGALRMIAPKLGIRPKARPADGHVKPRRERVGWHDRRFSTYLAASRFACEQSPTLHAYDVQTEKHSNDRRTS
ncbi:xylulose kinase [Nitratireductor mangrovi]|uniref:Xylulose kinase n=1 Tax=Nitratireductor mangrovi TaxID=2599600 RepID=A0A5B8KWL2_9HYPH|nr:FGGY family carbohydrate kinase [Nitratireductor mangrovi]QDZ00107.1 xylulose kinase [Nitratireductor mangrovi]